MITETKVAETKLQFQHETLCGILKVQSRLIEIMNDMKNKEGEEEDEEEDLQEFEAVLDLYKTLSQIAEL